MACGLPVVVTGAGPVLDYATSETAYLIPAERRPLGDRIVGGLETIGQPWLFEPDVDVLVELMKRVVSDRDGRRELACRRVLIFVSISLGAHGRSRLSGG